MIHPIHVGFVNPAYTSQTCPICGMRNKAVDRRYTCGCGFQAQRDRVAGINIMQATVKEKFVS
ncbi:zinc ribbon domain-containing protein [Brevibacillus sp. NPDC058079]|uniref:zinc ribbon domain-containing protein n=1 Tax=Brevibacillus sp. NPDC058079 TaxID=3346330 RepID=UPI0036E6A6BF